MAVDALAAGTVFYTWVKPDIRQQIFFNKKTNPFKQTDKNILYAYCILTDLHTNVVYVCMDGHTEIRNDPNFR